MKKRMTPEMVSKKMIRKDRKKERRLLRRKKTAVFFIVFFGVVGLLQVDAACADLVDRPPLLNVEIRKVNRDTVSFHMLGETAYLNVRELEERIRSMGEEVERWKDRVLDFFSGLSDEQPQPGEEPELIMVTVFVDPSQST